MHDSDIEADTRINRPQR